MQAAREGAPDATRRLYDLFVGRVMRVARPLCRSQAEAEDVVQETFVQALAGLHRYTPRPGARFVSWLLTIARNTALKSARHRRLVATDPADLDVAPEPGPDAPVDHALDQHRRKRALLEALEALPERDRGVVTLRYGGGLSAREVGEITGLTEANVRKICQRCKGALLARVQERLT